MSGCGLRTSRPRAPSTLPSLGLWWAQDLTPGSNLTPHLHPSVHPLQQAHPSKLDWGKAGGRDFRKTQHFCFLTSCGLSDHLEDQRRDREADGMFFGEKGLLQQS